MLFDTDVLIWYFRGNLKSAELIQRTQVRCISVIVYMELLQGARDKSEVRLIRKFLKESGFQILPLTENIGHRASVYLEEYCLKSGMCMVDALLAATAIENQMPLCTANRKHYCHISGIELSTFSP